MANRYQGGILGVGFNPLRAPNAPTIGTATSPSGTTASVAFTAPANVGGSAITSYAMQSTPDGIGATGSSSPITVSGLTTGTAYTFRVTALNSYGPSPASAASNSVTPVAQGQQAFTTAGTYSWVAPAGVTSVSVVAVGGGYYAGGGLGYKNNISVTPGSSYTVSVGAGLNFLVGTPPSNSYFISAGTVQGAAASVVTPGGYVGDGGGSGGQYYGGGAGGYSGAGGQGKSYGSVGVGTAGSGGGGGGGAGYTAANCNWRAGGGGGVGILGQGSNGAGGTSSGSAPNGGGGGSGGTAGGFSNASFVTGNGGVYGGGSGRNEYVSLCQSCGANGGGGAVRIIWPGTTRSFPSTNTGDL